MCCEEGEGGGKRSGTSSVQVLPRSLRHHCQLLRQNEVLVLETSGEVSEVGQSSSLCFANALHGQALITVVCKKKRERSEDQLSFLGFNLFPALKEEKS